MDRPKFDMLIELVNEYDDVEKEKIKSAFEYAKNAHQGQRRESGEDYIIHPLMVACILARMHADSNTICAGLLHDTLEDTKTTKEELDPKKYGVIVIQGHKKGLLLPDLEGVDSVDYQLEIACEKAGISPSEEYEIERFEVKRYKEEE